MQRCFFKKLSESPSEEGKNLREQYKQIDFKRCAYRCAGYSDYGICKYYIIQQPEKLEIMLS